MAPAHIRYPKGPILRVPSELGVSGVPQEEVLHLSGSRVVLADYDVLQHDFPELSTDNLIRLNPQLQHLTSAAQEKAIHSLLDDWLIWNAAFISTAQAAQESVNTRILTDSRRAVAYRPPRYGRAVVMPIQPEHSPDSVSPCYWPSSEGLLDLKGAGVAPHVVPTDGLMSTGLEYLGIAISDYLLKRVIDEIFARASGNLWTVPIYAVLDLGFDIRNWYLGTGPAGMHVRRAHRRPVPGENRDVEDRVSFEIEFLLRRYGITTATRGRQYHIVMNDGRVVCRTGIPPYQPLRMSPALIGISLALLVASASEQLTIDRRDVQLAREFSLEPTSAQMLDFGHLRVEQRFDCPTIRGLDQVFLGGMIWPDSSDFVQPVPALCLPREWNRYDLASWCFSLASQFRSNSVSREDLRRLLEQRLSMAVAKWPEPKLEHT